MLSAPRNLLKSNATTFERLLRVTDPILIIAVGCIAYRWYLGSFALPPNYWVALMGMALLSTLVFPAADLYRPKRGASIAEDLQALASGWLIMATIGVLITFATKTSDTYSRVWVASLMIGGLFAHAWLRVSMRLTLRWLRRRGYNLRHVVIVGAGELGREVATRLREAPWSGYALRGFYDDAPGLAGSMIDGLPVLGTIDSLYADIEKDGVDQIWIALPLRDEGRIRQLSSALQDYPVLLRYIPDIFGFELLRHSFSEIAGMPVISLTDSPMEGASRVLKATEDLVLATLSLIVAAPLLVIIAVAIKLTSAGPVFYRQERVTWNGRRFVMLKFRSMPENAEAGSGPVWPGQASPRSTRLGGLLRRYSLDELPQLLNVLVGDMSLVGPRPERPEFVEQFRKDVPGYMQKHLVKAGMTGWAQVHDLRGSSDLATRIQYDLYYIDNWSLWLDFRILTMTVSHVFSSVNAR